MSWAFLELYLSITRFIDEYLRISRFRAFLDLCLNISRWMFEDFSDKVQRLHSSGLKATRRGRCTMCPHNSFSSYFHNHAEQINLSKMSLKRTTNQNNDLGHWQYYLHFCRKNMLKILKKNMSNNRNPGSGKGKFEEKSGKGVLQCVGHRICKEVIMWEL